MEIIVIKSIIVAGLSLGPIATIILNIILFLKYLI